VICTRKGGEKCSGDYCIPPDYDKMRLPQVSHMCLATEIFWKKSTRFGCRLFWLVSPPPPTPLSSHLIEPFFSLCSEYTLLFKAERKGEEMNPKNTTGKGVELLKYIDVKAFPVLGGQKSGSNKF